MRHKRRSVAVATLTAAAVVASSGWAAAVTGDGVNSFDTSAWVPPSPDPSGIAFVPGTDRMVVSDGEVDEILAPQPGAYQGTNLFSTTRTGVLTSKGTTLPWSSEPTGVAYGAGSLYVTDDDKKRVFEIKPGADGTFGTADDVPTAPKGFQTSTFGNTDPEGVAYDSKRTELLLINGQTGAMFFRLKPGADGVFNGVAPGGDDIASGYDLSRYGVADPEGIAYDAGRDTVVVVDGSTEDIYELDVNGGLLNTIDINDVGTVNAAGIEVAPASDGSGASHYYVVDRGLDNNNYPDENDGKVFEISANLGVITNRPPAADAGVDQIIDLGETVTLTGAGVDSDAGDTLTYRWTVSGPGTVELATPTAATTTASSFSVAGDYVFQLAVSDGEATGVDQATVRVFRPGDARNISVPIAHGADDAQEGGGTSGKFVDLASADNELGNDGPPTPDPMLTGFRFSGLPIPQGSEIVSARIQFKVDEGGAEAASYTIAGEAADTAAGYVATAGNISARVKTRATVPWAPAPWAPPGPAGGDAGPDQLTPNLKSVLQEIVNRPGWRKGNAAAFMIWGTGRRTAEAKDGLTPPVLLLEFKTGVPNAAPVVDAGADSTVTMPASATLSGTVRDDGLPTPPGVVTAAWTRVSGPGTVTFADPTKAATTASFTEPGSYTLRLTGNDGALSAADEVVVTVQEPSASTTKVTLRSPLASVRHAGTVRLSGSVTTDGHAVAESPVAIFVRRAPDGDLVRLASATTDAEGTFTFQERADVTSRYVAAVGDAWSGVVRVKVLPRLRAAVTHPAVLVGTRTAIVGQVSPATSGHRLRLQRWNGSIWRTVATRSLAEGLRVRYRFVVVPQRSGVTRYRVVSPAQGGRARAVAPGGDGLVVRAYRASIERVDARRDLVVVRNTGAVRFTLAGWRLVERRAGERVILPDFTVRPGRAVRIHSGRGADDRRDLYLGTGEMWAVHGVAELRDARTRLADRLRF